MTIKFVAEADLDNVTVKVVNGKVVSIQSEDTVVASDIELNGTKLKFTTTKLDGSIQDKELDLSDLIPANQADKFLEDVKYIKKDKAFKFTMNDKTSFNVPVADFKSVEISQEAGNALVEKADGLYVPETQVKTKRQVAFSVDYVGPSKTEDEYYENREQVKINPEDYGLSYPLEVNNKIITEGEIALPMNGTELLIKEFGLIEKELLKSELKVFPKVNVIQVNLAFKDGYYDRTTRENKAKLNKEYSSWFSFRKYNEPEDKYKLIPVDSALDKQITEELEMQMQIQDLNYNFAYNFSESDIQILQFNTFDLITSSGEKVSVYVNYNKFYIWDLDYSEP